MGLSTDELAMAYHQGWADRNPETIVSMHSADSVFHVHGGAEPAVGQEAVRILITSLLTLVPDLHFETKRVYIGEDHIAFEYNMSGTYEDAHFVCDGADVIAVADGLVTRKDTYLDRVALGDQIGSIPQFGATV